ncbi:MAG: hypothetical protein ACI3Y0_10900 [Prevotella sp.]
MRKLILPLIAVVLLAACSGRQKAPADNTPAEEVVADSASVSDSFDALVLAEAKALVDSSYFSTEEYQSICEKYSAVMDKWLEGKDEAGRIEAELNLAKSALERHGRYFATHTDEMRDPLNQKFMMTCSKKVRELQKRNITIKR